MLSESSILLFSDTYLPIVYSDTLTNDSAAQTNHYEGEVDDDNWKLYIFIEEDYIYHLDTTLDQYRQNENLFINGSLYVAFLDK